MIKRCHKCGYNFEGEGLYCSGCKNGHGGNRIEDPEITEALDEFFGYKGPSSDETGGDTDE